MYFFCLRDEYLLHPQEDATDVGEEVSSSIALNAEPAKEDTIPRSSARDAGRHSNLADEMNQRPEKDEQSINAEKVPLEDPSSKGNADTQDVNTDIEII